MGAGAGVGNLGYLEIRPRNSTITVHDRTEKIAIEAHMLLLLLQLQLPNTGVRVLMVAAQFLNTDLQGSKHLGLSFSPSLPQLDTVKRRDMRQIVTTCHSFSQVFQIFVCPFVLQQTWRGGSFAGGDHKSEVQKPESRAHPCTRLCL